MRFDTNMNRKRIISIYSALVLALGALILSGGTVLAISSPTILNIVPGAGPSSGGTNLTITGANFQSGATVDLVSTTTQTFNYTGAASSWTVPANEVGPITFMVNGASGGNSAVSGDYGQYMQATLSAASSTPGTVIYYNVGQEGSPSGGGYNGGGDPFIDNLGATGGGGMSWISYSLSFSTSTVLLVAGGGGGGGNDGGGASGSNGTQTQGGAGG